MRFCLLYFLCITSLTGCVYYGDIHGNAKPLSATTLTTSHRYTSSATTERHDWWQGFNDPQLNQLITVALSDSPTMAMAENRVRRADQLADGAIAAFWPSVDMSGYAQRQRFSQVGLVPPPFNGKTFNIGQVGLNFNYEFDFWGKNRQEIAAQVSETCALAGDLAQARLVISAAVANTYFQLMNDIKQASLADQNWQEDKEIAAIVLDRANNGIESDIPVKTALASEQASRLSVERYRQMEAMDRHQLAVLLGKNPLTTDIMTKPFVYRHHSIQIPSSLTVNVLANRPDIYAAKMRAEAAAHRINVAKARFFPNVNLSALLSLQSVQFGKLFLASSQNNAITGAFDLPIFDAGARRASLGARYAEYDLAVNNYNDTILNALRDVADQQSILQSLNRQVSTQRDALDATSHNYTLFNARYKHGIIDYIQLLQVKQALLQQQATQVNLQAHQLQATIGLLKALGGHDISRQG